VRRRLVQAALSGLSNESINWFDRSVHAAASHGWLPMTAHRHERSLLEPAASDN